MLLFHGFSGSGRQISDLTGLPARAGRLGMFAAAPDGTGGTWSTPDPPFIDVLLRSLTRTRCVDLTRIYLTGFSAGAAFSISYACRHQNEIAAIAPVAVDLPLGCAGPTSILVFHGTADPLVAYAAGGQGASLPGLKLPGTMADMDAWAKLGRCRDSPTTVRLGTQVVRKTWPGCADGVEVGLYRIDGGGHTWPGADPKRGLGLTTTQVSATDQILAFFARHRLAG